MEKRREKNLTKEGTEDKVHDRSGEANSTEGSDTPEDHRQVRVEHFVLGRGLLGVLGVVGSERETAGHGNNQDGVGEHPSQDQVGTEHLVVILLFGLGITLLLDRVWADRELLHVQLVDGVDIFLVGGLLELEDLLTVLGDLGSASELGNLVVSLGSPGHIVGVTEGVDH